MIRSKEDKKTIYEIVIFIIAYGVILWINRPIISFSFLALIISSWSFNIYSKNQYKKGNSKYLLFPADNDKYFRNSSIILGLSLLIVAIIAALVTKNFNHIKIVGIVTSVIVVFNGLFDLPKGTISIESNFIDITGLRDEVDLNKLLQIEILSTKIILTDVNNQTTELDNFNIDENSANLIENYILNNQINLDFKVVNGVK